MARYTEQFNRQDPLKFRPSLLAFTWPTILLQDARDLLKDFDKAALVQLATAIEHEIHALSDPEQFPTDKNHWIWTRVRAAWITNDFNSSRDSIRHTFGDLNIFLAFHDHKKFAQAHGLKRKTKEWHLLAVIAIWKLIDACEVAWGRKPESDSEGLSYANVKLPQFESTGLAMEAQAACGIALLRLEESRARSKTASTGGEKRNRINRANREEALRIANSHTYELKKVVVILIQDSLVKEITDKGDIVRYNKGVISRWLLKAKWKTTKRPKPKTTV